MTLGSTDYAGAAYQLVRSPRQPLEGTSMLRPQEPDPQLLRERENSHHSRCRPRSSSSKTISAQTPLAPKTLKQDKNPLSPASRSVAFRERDPSVASKGVMTTIEYMLFEKINALDEVFWMESSDEESLESCSSHVTFDNTDDEESAATPRPDAQAKGFVPSFQRDLLDAMNDRFQLENIIGDTKLVACSVDRWTAGASELNPAVVASEGSEPGLTHGAFLPSLHASELPQAQTDDDDIHHPEFSDLQDFEPSWDRWAPPGYHFHPVQTKNENLEVVIEKIDSEVKNGSIIQTSLKSNESIYQDEAHMPWKNKHHGESKLSVEVVGPQRVSPVPIKLKSDASRGDFSEGRVEEEMRTSCNSNLSMNVSIEDPPEGSAIEVSLAKGHDERASLEKVPRADSGAIVPLTEAEKKDHLHRIIELLELRCGLQKSGAKNEETLSQRLLHMLGLVCAASTERGYDASQAPKACTYLDCEQSQQSGERMQTESGGEEDGNDIEVEYEGAEKTSSEQIRTFNVPKSASTSPTNILTNKTSLSCISDETYPQADQLLHDVFVWLAQEGHCGPCEMSKCKRPDQNLDLCGLTIQKRPSNQCSILDNKYTATGTGRSVVGEPLPEDIELELSTAELLKRYDMDNLRAERKDEPFSLSRKLRIAGVAKVGKYVRNKLRTRKLQSSGNATYEQKSEPNCVSCAENEMAEISTTVAAACSPRADFECSNGKSGTPQVTLPDLQRLCEPVLCTQKLPQAHSGSEYKSTTEVRLSTPKTFVTSSVDSQTALCPLLVDLSAISKKKDTEKNGQVDPKAVGCLLDSSKEPKGVAVHEVSASTSTPELDDSDENNGPPASTNESSQNNDSFETAETQTTRETVRKKGSSGRERTDRKVHLRSILKRRVRATNAPSVPPKVKVLNENETVGSMDSKLLRIVERKKRRRMKGSPKGSTQRGIDRSLSLLLKVNFDSRAKTSDSVKEVFEE